MIIFVILFSIAFGYAADRFIIEKLAEKRMFFPFYEVVNCIFYIILYLYFGITIKMIFFALLTSMLIIVSIIDFKTQEIPDRLNFFILLLGLSHLLYNIKSLSVIESVFGFILAAVLFLAIAILSGGAMGGGDIKLMAALGLFFGWHQILLVTLFSFLIGAIISLILIVLGIKKRKDYIPFGPFISVAAFIIILYGNTILNWYTNAI